jgi:hypothetical protein
MNIVTRLLYSPHKKMDMYKKYFMPNIYEGNIIIIKLNNFITCI